MDGSVWEKNHTIVIIKEGWDLFGTFVTNGKVNA